MKKYLVLLIFIMQGTVGMLSVDQLFDYIGDNGLCDLSTFDTIKGSELTELHEKISTTDFKNISIDVVPMVYLVSDVLIHEKKYHDAAVLLATAYNRYRNEYVNKYSVITSILRTGKNITIQNIEEYLNLPEVPMHLKVLGMIIDLYVKNPSKDLSTLCLDSIPLSQAKEFLSNYPLYRRRKLIAAPEQERIKSEFIEKIAHNFKK